MKTYKARVTKKGSSRIIDIERKCKNKGEFINQLRLEGYAVNPVKVKTKVVFDFIINHTKCSSADWKINKFETYLLNYREINSLMTEKGVFKIWEHRCYKATYLVTLNGEYDGLTFSLDLAHYIERKYGMESWCGHGRF